MKPKQSKAKAQTPKASMTIPTFKKANYEFDFEPSVKRPNAWFMPDLYTPISWDKWNGIYWMYFLSWDRYATNTINRFRCWSLDGLAWSQLNVEKTVGTQYVPVIQLEKDRWILSYHSNLPPLARYQRFFRESVDGVTFTDYVANPHPFTCGEDLSFFIEDNGLLVSYIRPEAPDYHKRRIGRMTSSDGGRSWTPIDVIFEVSETEYNNVNDPLYKCELYSMVVCKKDGLYWGAVNVLKTTPNGAKDTLDIRLATSTNGINWNWQNDKQPIINDVKVQAGCLSVVEGKLTILRLFSDTYHNVPNPPHNFQTDIWQES